MTQFKREIIMACKGSKKSGSSKGKSGKGSK